MLTPENSPSIDPEEILASQDADTIMKAWPNSGAFQSEIARKVYVIKDEETGSKLADFFEARFEEADEIETANLITAMEHLGVRNEKVNLKTNDFLVRALDFDKGDQVAKIKALKTKSRICYRDYYDEKSSYSKEGSIDMIEKSGRKFLEIIADEETDKTARLEAMRSLYCTKLIPELKEEAVTLFKKLALSPDPEVSKMATGELVDFLGAGDKFLSDLLFEKIKQLDYINLPKEAILDVVIYITHSGDSRTLPYLREILQNTPEEKKDHEFISILNRTIERVKQR